jgi:Protein of unknown function (DUF1566)
LGKNLRGPRLLIVRSPPRTELFGAASGEYLYFPVDVGRGEQPVRTPAGPETGGPRDEADWWDVPRGELSDGVETAYIPVQKCVPTGVNVPVTGQTSSVATGDDGDIGAGFPFPSPRFTDNGDGTVTDNLTGLIWLKLANCWMVEWSTALTNVAVLASGTCDLTDGSSAGDWRLPNRNELESLIDIRFSFPPVSNAAGTAKWATGDAFDGIQGSWYWSSSTMGGNSSNAFVVDFGPGGVFVLDKGATCFVLPVRGGL